MAKIWSSLLYYILHIDHYKDIFIDEKKKLFYLLKYDRQHEILPELEKHFCQKKNRL